MDCLRLFAVVRFAIVAASFAALSVAVAGCGAPPAEDAAAAASEEQVDHAAGALSTCRAVVAAQKARVDDYHYINVHISLHREDPNWGVQYVSAKLWGGAGPLKGDGWEYFSIRKKGGIPFGGDAEYLGTITLDDDAVLRIHNTTWNFDQAVSFGCVGNVLTAYQPGGGQWTMTFADTGYIHP